MDIKPNSNNPYSSSDQNSGEIFSGGDNSVDNQQLNSGNNVEIPQETEPNKSADIDSFPQDGNNMEMSNNQIPNSTLPAAFNPSLESPPMYTENRGKKLLIIAVFVIIILISIILFLKLFRKKSTQTPKSTEVKLTYWGLWEPLEVFKPLIDEYKKVNPNVTIEYLQQNPSQYRERLQAAVDRGDGPDIFRFHNTWTQMLANQLSPLPVAIYSEADFKNTFYPIVSNDVRIGNSYYGIPLEIDGLLLLYNEDILKAANIDVPKTWIDIQNAVPKLTVKEQNKIITSAIALGTAENIEFFSDILALMMIQNGTQLSKSLFTCTNNNITNCSVETLTFYRSFADLPNNTWDDSLENSIIAFASGKVAMIFATSWEIPVIKNLNPNLNFKTAPVPQLPCEKDSCPFYGWASYWIEGVSSKSLHQKEAWDFLKFLSSKDNMQKLFELETKQSQIIGEPYSRVDLGSIMKDNIYLAPLISQAPNMKSFYLASRTSDGETGLNSGLIKYLKDAVNSLSQGVSVESALKTADNGFKQVLSRFNLSQ